MSALGDAEAAVEAVVPETRLARPVLAVTGILIVAAIVGFAFWWVFVHPHALKQAAAQAKADTQIQAGAAQAATDAMKITVDTSQLKASVDALTRENTNAILAAKGADAPVDPAVGDALLAALCLRDAYRAQPGCAAVQAAGGRLGPAGSDAGGAAPAGVDRR